MTRLGTFARLDPRARRLAVVVAAALVVGRVGLVAGLGTVRTSRGVSAVARCAPPADHPPRTVGGFVANVADALPGHYSCLVVALVGLALFERSGHDATLRIGVSKDDGSFRAHAWVEHDGSVVLGGVNDIDGYRTLPLDRVDDLVPAARRGR